MSNPTAGGGTPARGAGARLLLLTQFGLAIALALAVESPLDHSAQAYSVPITRAAEVAGGSVGIRLVDIPAATADDPRTREYIVDHLQPGDSISRRVEISNTTDSDLTVAVYPGAANINNDAFIGAEAGVVNDLTSWTALNDSTTIVPPGGAVFDTATISIPPDAAPGEYYGVIWAEVNGTANGPVALMARTGIRVYLSVGGNNPPASSFDISSITAERTKNGTAQVTASVDNTGGRALDLSGTLTLTAVTGALTAGPYPVSVGTTLAPTTTGEIEVVIADDIANGPWTAALELHSGLITETETVEVTFPEHVGSSAPVPVTQDHTPLVILGTALLVTVVMLSGWLFAHRHKQATTQ